VDTAVSQPKANLGPASILANAASKLKRIFDLSSSLSTPSPMGSDSMPNLVPEVAVVEPATNPGIIRSDEPIRTAGEDVLGRARVAAAIAESIRNVDASQGAVIGILGPWGSGKTSLVNLVLEELGREPAIPAVHFNPWMFSGADQLVESFFAELGAQLKLADNRFQRVADDLARYGDLLAPLRSLPFIGPWTGAVGDATKAFQQFMEDRRGGVQGLRNTLIAELQQIDTPIVVVIDDIDRLQTDEIRDIFKLVRLTANFPKMIYLVAFDRERVERALEDQGLPGQAYLEKIAQVIYDIPSIPSHVFEDLIAGAINEALATVPDSLKTLDSRITDVFHDVIQPQFRHMRDVRRYVASLPATLRSLDNRVALSDVLALESIRVLQPAIFNWIARNADVLTTPSGGAFWSEQRDEMRAESLRKLLADHRDQEPLIRALVRRLFPAAERHIENVAVGRDSLPGWQRDHRVAHPEYLGLYLQRVAGQELQAFWRAEEAVELLADRANLEAYFRSLDPSEWEGIIRSLQLFGDAFPVDAVEPATVALLNLIDELPDRPQGLMDFGGPRTQVVRVVVQLLRRLGSAEQVEAVVRQAIPEIPSAGARLELLNLVGHQEHVGLKMISVEASNELESELRGYIRARPASELAYDPQVIRTLFWAKQTALPVEPDFEFPADASLSCAVLKSAVTESTSITIGTSVPVVEKQLFWKTLEDLLGGDEGIRKVVEGCRSVEGDLQLVEAVALADRYLDGWRPQFP
jgi:hypothetical protein